MPNNKLFAREREEAELLAAFDRCCFREQQQAQPIQPPQLINTKFQLRSSTCASRSPLCRLAPPPPPPAHKELVLLTGPSGTGKTALVEQTLKDLIDQTGGLYLSGKFSFDHTVQATTHHGCKEGIGRAAISSYSAIKEAISTWVKDLLSPSAHSAARESLIVSVQEALDCVAESEPILLDVLADLRQLLPITVHTDSTGDVDTSSAVALPKAQGRVSQKRFALAFRLFLQRVCTLTNRPMVLFLDDLQWADPATLDLLAMLVAGGDKVAPPNTSTTTKTRTTKNSPSFDTSALLSKPATSQTCMSDPATSRSSLSSETSRNSEGHMFPHHHNTATDERGGVIPGLLVVGACRGNEVTTNHPLSVMLRELESSSSSLYNKVDDEQEDRVKITEIRLTNLSPAAVGRMVAHVLLSSSPQDDDHQEQPLPKSQKQLHQWDVKEFWPLADIVYRYTQGNVFFVLQFLKTLQEEGLLYKTLPNSFESNTENLSRWEWKSEHEMADIFLRSTGSSSSPSQPTNATAIQSLLDANIKKLHPHVQYVLMIAASLGGADFDQHLLEQAVTLSSFEVEEALSIAEEKGYIILKQEEQRKRKLQQPEEQQEARFTPGPELQTNLDYSDFNGSISSISSCNAIWAFAHDQIQQTSYLMIPENKREEIHLSIGRKLFQSLSSNSDAELWHNSDHSFLVINQLRLGARLITNPDERERMAILLLRTGEKSAESSMFTTAASHLSLGISLLGDRHWRDQYELSLELFNASAEVEYCLGNFEIMDQLIQQVLQNARCNTDKTRALTTSIYSLGSRNELQKCIDLGLKVLDEYFNESFPSNPGIFSILLELRKTKNALLRYKSDDEILNMPLMHDPTKLSAMRILNLMFPYTLNGRPMHAPLISMRLMQLTLRFGMSGMACVGFSSFGMLNCTAFGDVKFGIRLANLSLSILDKFDAKEWLARTHCFIYGFCFAMTGSWKDLLKPLLISHRVGLGSGDIEFSMISAALYSALAIGASKHLPQLHEDMIPFLELTNLHTQTFVAQFLRPNMQLVMNLMGKCKDPCVLNGSYTNEDAAMKEAAETKNVFVMVILLLVKLQILSYFQDYEAAEKVAMELSKVKRNSFVSGDKAQSWLFEGLASVALASKDRRRRRKRMAVGRRCLNQLHFLAKTRSFNISSKVLILEAEIDSANGKFHQALQKYDLAAEKACDEQLWCDAGIANERAAHVLFEKSRHCESCEHLERAIVAYEEWGAYAKVSDVKGRLRKWEQLN